MQNNNNYKLVGIIDSLSDFPDFVRPVFEKEGKHYFQYGKNGIICTFKEIPKEMSNRVLNLDDVKINTNMEIKEMYTLGDNPVICFRLNKDTYFISDIDNFVPFIKEFNTDDDILKEEIDYLIDGINRKNNEQKKRIKQRN